jgi:uncharacterized protein (TIGR03089 family)
VTSTAQQPATPSACLAALLAADPARPRLTSIRPDERLDLSAATLANWVAKTANLLRDELLVEPGDVVGLALPRHWLAAVWLLAADAVGVAVSPGGPDARLVDTGPEAVDPQDMVAMLVGPDAAPAALNAALGAGVEVLVASLRPFGLPAEPPPAAPLRDFAEAVRAHGDRFSGPDVDPSLPLLTGPVGPALTRQGAQRAAVTYASQAGWDARSRVLSEGPVTGDSLVAGLLGPWSAGGSAVWVGNLGATQIVTVVKQERVTDRV